ncbi:hypothetical protein GE061_016672 [Apolygus lucorum]|uniref:Dynein regulatory complex protein 1 C-terminal domain-containing protein n=1 Tax=Apolygus lucorum TaxID=248454 RepID=A0A8S9XGQ1_APOLU|nr:hypothetical protein GE061_016672 [Apolygus lucorum]
MRRPQFLGVRGCLGGEFGVSCSVFTGLQDDNDQLVKADKKFHTSLLCVSWHVPTIEFSRKLLPSYVEARALIKEDKGKGSANDFWPDMEKRDMQKLFSLVLDSIENKTEFLIDDTLKILLEPLTPTSKTLITINSLFNALGMREKDDIEYMSKFFLPYVVCKLCEKSENDEETTDESPEVAPMLKSTPEIVSERLKKQFAMTNQVIKDEFCTRGAILNLVTGDDELVIRENDPRDEKILKKHEILGTEVDPTQLPILAQKSPSKICEPDPQENQQEKVAGKLRRLETLMCSKPGHRPGINPNHVSKALNEFVTKLNEERKSKELVSLKEILTQKSITESRLLTKFDVEAFWGGFKKVFSEKKKMMWRSLLTQMKVCYKILLKRHNTNGEVKKLRQRNEELRRLISKYLDTVDNRAVTSKLLDKLPFLYAESEDSLSTAAEDE